MSVECRNRKQVSSQLSDQKQKRGFNLVANYLKGENVYVVQKGETLNSVAIKFGTSSATLRKMNRLATDHIFEGQKLIVPNASQ